MFWLFYLYRVVCLVLLIQSSIHLTKGTVCFQCDSIPSSHDMSSCTNEVKCPGTEVCYVSLSVDGAGQVSHRTGCSDPKLCTQATMVEPGPIGKRDNSLCSSCCQGDRCNNRTCLLTAIEQCTEWSTWAACDVTCGGGKQTRSRQCSKDFQQTTELDSRYCSSPACPVHTVCNDVLDDCSLPDIKQAMCATPSLALQYCKNTCGLCSVDGHWSEWSEWSACSASCGDDAHRIRLRLCNSPAPKNNGSNCHGRDRERLDCQTPCPVDGHWSDWSPWGTCTQTCGGGLTLRIRNCNNPVPQNGGKPCENPTRFKETKSCGNIDCPVDGHWSDWSPWGTCTQTCGVGLTLRIRNCNNPVPQNGGKPCENPVHFKENKSCGNIDCPVDGHWSDWSAWGTCTQTCGGGQTLRIRNCNNPVPQNGGKPCENPTHFKETKSCGNIDCPVDGQWSDWSPWRPCSKTCGGGQTFRIRNCNNPVPQNGGEPCENPSHFKETKSCGNTDCPVDGHWSEWSPWHPCSVTCGGGNTFRSRTCSNPVPKHGGKSCENPGSFVERLSCNSISCSDPGYASATTSLVSVTSSAVTSVPSLVPSVGCNDQAFCTDSHILPLVCQDVYVATTYCPKLCGICGATSSPTPCVDSVGGSCNDPLYIQFACADNELAALCAKTCGVCH